MPKLKTKSGAKKRFKMTGTGKVKVAAQGKRHGMIKRTAKFVRNARGTMVLCDSDARIVKKYMPYAADRASAASRRLTACLDGVITWHASSAASPPTPSTRRS